MSYRSRLTAKRRREERVKGRSDPAGVSWEMRWVEMSFSAHKPGDRSPPSLPCTLCMRPLLLILQISSWYGFCCILSLQGWWEDCRLLLCLESQKGWRLSGVCWGLCSTYALFLAVFGFHSRGLPSSGFRELCCNYLLLIQTLPPASFYSRWREMDIYRKCLTLTCCRHLNGLNHSLQYLFLCTVSTAGTACLDVGSARHV